MNNHSAIDNFEGVFGVVHHNLNEIFIPADGAWIHYNTPVTEQQSIHWVSPG